MRTDRHHHRNVCVSNIAKLKFCCWPLYHDVLYNLHAKCDDNVPAVANTHTRFPSIPFTGAQHMNCMFITFCALVNLVGEISHVDCVNNKMNSNFEQRLIAYRIPWKINPLRYTCLCTEVSEMHYSWWVAQSTCTNEWTLMRPNTKIHRPIDKCIFLSFGVIVLRVVGLFRTSQRPRTVNVFHSVFSCLLFVYHK